jgi:NAD(P)-dependent dehydrogenase (short-subunit alcohol dehydrogenase family)
LTNTPHEREEIVLDRVKDRVAIVTGSAGGIGGGFEYTHEILGAICPLDRMGTPEEIAYGILFLASDEASFITATELVIDGGMIGAPPPVYPDVTYPGKKRKP